MNVTLMLFNLLLPAYPLVGIAMVICGVLRIFVGVFGAFIGIFILFSTYELWRALEQDQIEQHPLFKMGSSEQSGTTMYSVETRPAPQNMQGPAKV
jgi:hypothetical protein